MTRESLGPLPTRRRTFTRLGSVALALVAFAGCHDTTAPAGADRVGRPDRVEGPWTSVSIGGTRSCALDLSGRAYCWGANSLGALGLGGAGDRVARPTPVAGLGEGLRAVTVGGSHQCVLTSTGAALCWGVNAFGALGTGSRTTTNSGVVATPVPVTGGLTFVSIDAGLGHTCALTEGGVAYCWGSNVYAELGIRTSDLQECDGTDADPCAVASPTRVAVDFRFTQISTGGWHSCGIAQGGAADCWGYDAEGLLGSSAAPVFCSAFPTYAKCPRVGPVAVRGGLRFRQISAGWEYSCGVTLTDQAYCWGRGTGGPVLIPGGLTFREVSAGSRVGCGITLDQRPVCWGDNNFVQLGIGTLDPSISAGPRSVLMPLARRAPALADYDDHACALATSGRIWCWGGVNWDGELGSGKLYDPSDWPPRWTPEPVDPPAVPLA
jgi:alpha-tubulin suppressor-like RCC1 family protein